MTTVGYIVHDLRDMAVARRTSALRKSGIDVLLAGFVRRDASGETRSVPEGLSLGQTIDGKLGLRAVEVFRNVVSPNRLKEEFRNTDVIVARNLESLMIAARVAGDRPIVYECLDIHRLLLGNGLAGRFIKAVERYLLSRCELIIVSSPAFEREYFAVKPSSPPVMVIENKVPASIASESEAALPNNDGTFTIAWFGMLRCRRSFEVLSRLCKKYDGKLRVLIAGKPSTAEFEDFASMAAKVPNMTFVGPYSAEDLPTLYSQCHFAWTIDWFEEGLNSTWLLPNRLYEAAAFGVVPIALSGVETGQWLKRREAGLIVNDIPSLYKKLEALDGDQYGRLASKVVSIPRSDLVKTSSTGDRLAATIKGLVSGGGGNTGLQVARK
ncbi:glycosyltransferase [Croceicoccus marinus]|uniref:Glycosyltransferase subfamily 4-like N-terminal domain-containing protein n=1 Tax=Croceicoccus marinus TaxID=450378 RepID=A0A7G6VT10_9SPHN|nr:glycosyltransferase [Croceicoccus marinus]QNE04875.1 hypothetical protein H4O24_13260 [Croceicoccus marinus]